MSASCPRDRWSAARKDRRRRLDRETADDGLSGGDAAQDAAGVVGQKQRLAVGADADLVGIRLAGQFRGGHAGADLDALHRVDAHHRRGDVLVELAVDRRAEAGGHALGDHLDHGADRGAGFTYVVEIALPTRAPARVGQKEGFMSTAYQSNRERSIFDASRSVPAPRGSRRLAGSYGRWRRRRRASPSRAPRSARRRGSRGCRISPST